MITDMILEFPEATATWRLWCQRSSQVRSSPQQRLLCWYSMMKATINAPTLAEQANASTHPSADQLQRRPFRSAHRGRPTTPTYQQSKRLGGYHRLTPMTQELPACSALSAQLVRLTVPHHPSARVSLQFLPVRPLTTSFTVSANSVVDLPVTFSSTTTGGTGPYTVSWSFGDGSTGSGATVTHSYSTAQTYTVTESVKDSSVPQQTATSSLTVN